MFITCNLLIAGTHHPPHKAKPSLSLFCTAIKAKFLIPFIHTALQKRPKFCSGHILNQNHLHMRCLWPFWTGDRRCPGCRTLPGGAGAAGGWIVWAHPRPGMLFSSAAHWAAQPASESSCERSSCWESQVLGGSLGSCTPQPPPAARVAGAAVPFPGSRAPRCAGKWRGPGEGRKALSSCSGQPGWCSHTLLPGSDNLNNVCDRKQGERATAGSFWMCWAVGTGCSCFGNLEIVIFCWIKISIMVTSSICSFRLETGILFTVSLI